MTIVALAGGDLQRDETLRCDVVVVGSGPGGATVARALADEGADVVVLEEGSLVEPQTFTADPVDTLARLYRDAGLATTRGRAPMSLLQGRVLGGTSVVNSGICWRLPRDVYDEWCTADPAIEDALPWESLDAAAEAIERSLGVAPTDPAVAGANSDLMARGADALGLAHRPTDRNVAGCRGSARCNQGCPHGAKLSMDRTFLPDAVRGGTRVVTDAHVEEIVAPRGRATGVVARTPTGARLRVWATRAVVLAAGATQTPLLLFASGITRGPVGRYLQCHPGIAVAGRFPECVRGWTGATQGHEITALMGDRIKIETVAFDPSLLAYRVDSTGRELAVDVAGLSQWATWGAGIRAHATGTVRPGRHRARVSMELTDDDVRRVRRAVRVIGDVMLAAGATAVAPGVAGWHRRVTDTATMARLEDEGPLDPRAYSLAVSHLFGTCRLGSDPATSVIRPDFRHHAVDRLYVADASVFPTNLGVNPQISIMTMATRCAASVAA